MTFYFISKNNKNYHLLNDKLKNILYFNKRYFNINLKKYFIN